MSKERQPRKYKRHLTLRIAIGMAIVLLLVQLLFVAFNSLGLIISSFATSFTSAARISDILDRSLDADEFIRCAKAGEKSTSFIEDETDVRDYMYALGDQIKQFKLIWGNETDGYYCLVDIRQDQDQELSFLDKMDKVTPSVIEKIRDAEAKSAKLAEAEGTEEDKGALYNLEIFNALSSDAEIDAVLGMTREKTDMIYGHVLDDDVEGDEIFSLQVVNAMSMFELPKANLEMLATGTIVATILLLVILMVWVYRRVVSPLKMIKESAVDFIGQTRESESAEGWTFQAPAIRTKDEIQELGDTVEEMAEGMKEAVKAILSDTKEKERMKTELALAAGIQNSMLPSDFPAFPDRTDFDIYASMDPAKEIGGDFYDFFLVDDTHLCMFIADVSGKGIPAALFMMSSMLILSSLAKQGLSPAKILESANNQIEQGNEQNMFVTAWVGILDLETGILRAANAGHEYPYISQNGKGFCRLKDKHGFVLGELENIKHTEYELTLQPGEMVFVYTDGLTEANNREKEQFGTNRILEELNRDTGRTPEQILKDMTEALRVFTEDEPQFDDVTMLCVKYKKG